MQAPPTKHRSFIGTKPFGRFTSDQLCPPSVVAAARPTKPRPLFPEPTATHDVVVVHEISEKTKEAGRFGGPGMEVHVCPPSPVMTNTSLPVVLSARVTHV
jgi:hypothetical protein